MKQSGYSQITGEKQPKIDTSSLAEISAREEDQEQDGNNASTMVNENELGKIGATP